MGHRVTDPAMVYRNWLVRFRAKRSLRELRDSLLDEMGPIDFAEGALHDPWWLVAADLDYLESQMAGSSFWSLNARGRGFRADALEQVNNLLPRVRALPLPRTTAILEQMARILPAIDLGREREGR